MSQGLDVLIVDDEPLARRGIRELLSGRSDIVSIREATNGRGAVRLIGEARPDLVFLDVQMPGLDGFGVIEAVGVASMPPVIFVTAYEQHAVRAFEVHAVDYLLKPIDPDRFADALEHAQGTIDRDDSDLRRTVLATLLPLLRSSGSVPAAVPPAPGDRRLAIRRQGRILLVDPEEIDWVEALGNYVRLHRRGGALQHRATMEEMTAILGPAFVRIRRSALVRSSAVRYCEPLGKGSYVLVLHDNTRLTSSRYFRNQLAPLLGE
jgi:two-component system LytT family response regulator